MSTRDALRQQPDGRGRSEVDRVEELLGASVSPSSNGHHDPGAEPRPLPLEIEPEPESQTKTATSVPTFKRAVDGATFIFREPSNVPAVWGKDEAVAWSCGTTPASARRSCATTCARRSNGASTKPIASNLSNSIALSPAIR